MIEIVIQHDDVKNYGIFVYRNRVLVKCKRNILCRFNARRIARRWEKKLKKNPRHFDPDPFCEVIKVES